MHLACARAASRNSFCCSSESSGGLTASRYLRQASSAARTVLSETPLGGDSWMPRAPGLGSGMSTPWSRMQRAYLSAASCIWPRRSAVESPLPGDGSPPQAASASADAVSSAAMRMWVRMPRMEPRWNEKRFRVR
jgi:hypothetical protein